jgi:anti-sigma regulatory factor (Ser/Thr protein kinase)
MVEVGALQVPAELSSAATVRHNVADDLAAHGMPAELIDDAVLVASELVANAVRHAASLPSGKVVVSWNVDETGLRLCVEDGGGARRPELRTARPAETSGRGLSIVASLADGWGVEPTETGTAVWAHLPTPNGSIR